MADKKKTFLQEVNPDRVYEFELTGSHTQASHSIGRTSLVFDPVSGSEAVLRYVPGYTSLFQDDQPDIDPFLVPSYDVSFSYGKLKVDGKKKQLVQFLLAHDKIESNDHRIGNIVEFRLVDKTEEESNIRKNLKYASDAVSKAESSSLEDMLVYSRVLGIDTTKNPGEDDSAYEDRIRTRFMEKAHEKPKEFLDGINDPKHKRKYDILLGFDQGVITDSISEGSVNWALSKASITSIPAKRRADEYLTDYTFTEEGAKFYEQLKKLIKY